MALVRRESPVGIDSVIDMLQCDLFLELTSNFNWFNYNSYARAYKNKRDKNIVPEAYIGNGEYKDVLFDDKKQVTSFFLTDEKREYDNKKLVWTQDVFLIVQANVGALYGKNCDRKDEKLIDDVRMAINNKFWTPRMDTIITGVDKVYDSLKLNYDKKYFDDMNDFVVVRFGFKMVYNNTKNSNPIL